MKITVYLPDDLAPMFTEHNVLEALEPGASRHTLSVSREGNDKLTIKHSRLGVTIVKERE